MSSTYLSRTPSSATNRKTFTISCWFKRNNLANVGAFQTITAAIYDTGNYYGDFIRLTDDDTLDVIYYDGVVSYRLRTNRKFRDISAWYHLVVAFDTTQATASDRLKIYINGVQETSFQTETYPSLDRQIQFNNTVVHWVGFRNNEYWQGLMSHFHLIDGTAYDATAFGEFDANGVWKIKTSPSVTYGTNGFFILKDGNSVTDQSPNTNNFTVGGGTLTNTEDSPSNVFATMNPLDNYWQGSTFSNGNNTILTGSNSATFNTSTLLMTSGKYYVEVKPTVGSATLNIGVTGEQAVSASQTLASRGSGYAYLSSSGVFNNGSSVGGTFNSYSNGDIIGIAINLDDEQGGLNKLYFSKNGVWQNGADPSTPSSVTGVVGITKPSNLIGDSKMGAYAFAINETWNDNTRTVQWNFGNGYFGTTAVASAGTNASGIGIFEHDVPNGYTSLSTKGLNL